MTAAATQRTGTPPRVLVRTFWILHRAAYRISGGRVGLQRPAAGERFGMMQVASRGRRTGQPRTTILGYFEDGPNVVTLAMNGWGQTDPAWWLNLQANPAAVVTLADGPLPMRARAASGAERDRLWARFRTYPGWGEDIDALAARRPIETAVVVFEPASVQPGGGAIGATPTPRTASEPEAIAMGTIQEGTRERRGPKARHLWLIPGLAIAIFANGVANQHDLGLLPLLVFGIVPHLTVLAGVGQHHAPGQLAPRAVPLFNAMHHPATPLVVLAVAAAGVLPVFWYVGALAWLSHIVVDWALGDGRRTPDGFVRGVASSMALERAS